MYNYKLSTIIGFVAMVFAMSSYFVKKKSIFLIAQAGAILSLAFSCLFIVQYYAVVSYVLGLIRVGVFYLYERKGKSAPNWLIATFVGLYMLFYVIVNIVILQTFNALDILLLIANVFFTVAFSIRNLTLVRYIFLFPLAISVVYYVLIPGGSLFVIISYSFELLANAVAILYNSKFVYMYVKKRKERLSSKNK